MLNLPFIPYFTTSRYRVDAMIKLAQIKPGEKAADLGSGDGRILIALATAGTETHGYELDKTLIDNSRNKIIEAGFQVMTMDKITHSISLREVEGKELNTPCASTPLSNRKNKNVYLHKTNFWLEDLSVYDIITIYPMPDIMDILEEKLMKELKLGAKVLVNYYPFSHWKTTLVKDHIYLYIR